MNRFLEVVAFAFAKLLTVKSLVTLALTLVFAVQSLRGAVTQEFMTIYTVVIAFYYGTQATRNVRAASETRGGAAHDESV